MKFLVFETLVYNVESEDVESAIAERKTGAGEHKHTSWRAQHYGSKSVQPIPREEWPQWARALAKRATPEDKGIGDVVARTIGAEASGAFKAFYEMTFGKPCGCNGRQKLWNIKYPLNLKAT